MCSCVVAAILRRVWLSGIVAGSVGLGGIVPAPAQTAGRPDTTANTNDAITAEELINKGHIAYNTGDVEEAAGLLSEFLASYGESPQAAPALPTLLPTLAYAQIRLEKYDEAKDTIARALAPEIKLAGNTREELMFWNAVCLLQAEEFDDARSAFATFLEQFPQSAKSVEARILAATSYVTEEKWKEAVAALEPLASTVGPTERGRVVVLRLYSLMQAGDYEGARRLIIDEYPRLGAMIQIAAFQSLTLELGSHYLDSGENRKAIGCLQRVWKQEQLLRHQNQRLETLEAARAASERRNDAYDVFRLTQLIAKVRREIEVFGEIENFDAALRLRLGSAYLALERYHEAALILEEMLAAMPANKIVEEASVNLVQSWTQVERWPKVIDNAAKFLQRFRKSEREPLVLFMKGQAEQNDRRYDESVATFDLLRTKFPKDELAARAAFMAGFSCLLAEKNPEAIERLSAVRMDFGGSPMAEPAHYWLGMAYSLDKQFDQARDVLAEYLDANGKDGQYRGEAVFRRAYCAHSKKDYETGVAEFRDYLKAYPGHEQNNEALVLMGDAFCAIGEIDEGIAAYRRITPDERRFFEEGQFKIAKALRLTERIDEMRSHLETFAREHSDSSRLPEAIYWIGWSWRQQDQPEKARDLYWSTIATMGGDPDRRAMEDVFLGVIRLYKADDERRQLLARLRDLSQGDDSRENGTLASRALWAQAQVLRKPDPMQSRLLLEEAASRLNVSTANPLLIADCAEALHEGGRTADAAQMMRDLIKWNPRAAQKDRALAMLGRIALAEGRDKEALDYFTRFENEAEGSVLTAEVLTAKASLLRKRGESAAAIATLEKLLANPHASGERKAAALVEVGDLHLEMGDPKKAFPFYQRVYVMYGRWTAEVAKAYLRSGEILEKLRDTDGARRTYEEMLAREELAGTTEAGVARERLAALPKGAES